jgi:hypothetical protein
VVLVHLEHQVQVVVVKVVKQIYALKMEQTILVVVAEDNLLELVLVLKVDQELL